ELEGMAFLLERVSRWIGPAVDLDALSQHLGGLALGRRGADGAGDGDAAADRKLFDLRFIVGQRRFGEDLHVALAGAVVQLEEAEATFGIAAGADPALQTDLLADGFDLAGLGDSNFFHDVLLEEPVSRETGSAMSSTWLLPMLPHRRPGLQ